ncbi:MAG: D-2-hydroxyacid dehydrogenase [Planctomycetes bacterium]|nr:D-2-hydroxyacid dehydrogenase [Planctomycetota bacterium]
MSSNLKVLITVPQYEPTLTELRREPGVEFLFMDEPSAGVHGEIENNWPIEKLRDIDVLFCSGIAPKNFHDAKQVKWVQLASAGYEQYIPLGLPAKGIRASNALGTFDVPIGEWCAAMIVNLARDVRGMIRNQDKAVWDRAARFQREVRGSTVGFWGYGGLAREAARLCKAMNMTVHALTRSGVAKREDKYVVPGSGDPDGKLPDRVFRMEDRAEFLRGLDFLIVAMPMTNASRGAIGEEELRALPRHACLLNPARGPLIQEQALLRALREGWIAAAALDTHYHYPLPPDHPLWAMPNVILTPHIAGSGDTQTYPKRVWDIFSQNLIRFRDGRPLLNELSPKQLQGL